MANHRDISCFPGLTEAEASDRLKSEGYNELPTARKRTVLAIAFDVVREPMFLLLVACGTMYVLLGDMREAMLLLGFVFVVMGITLYQERKTERALEALRDLSSPRALVVRSGVERRIPGREVVRDDILVLAEGDRVPADAVVLSCVNLSVDESLLTGESVSVRKSAADGNPVVAEPGGDDLPFVYSGTMVVQGHGISRVGATGSQTQLGRIGKALQSVEQEKTLLQAETGRMVRLIGIAGLALCAIVIVVYGITRADLLHGFLAGITLAMALLPEELPVVLTIFLALGAWRMSQQRVLTRRVPAIETLGSATVLCVDKTGTLTQNQMSVRTMFAQGQYHSCEDSGKEPLPETFHELLEFGILAGQIDPFDPMEKAIKQFGEWYLTQTEHLHENWSLVHEYPLSKELLSLSRVWKSPDGEDYVIAAKGAPEAIADLCHLNDERQNELSVHIGIMADQGLRVLGVAKAGFRPVSLPGGQHDFPFEFVGLIGLADPVRDTVPLAIEECRTAGIRVVMITGDYPGTARNIARQIGLANPDSCITGPELSSMSDDDLKSRIRDVNIFARVVPEQKLRIVKALKETGEIVAMTGDGVNDAPALKSAHIGIAMGGRGTDVARESSALVLLDDDFSSIVRAVRMGRRIFDNIRKAIAYILAIHVPIAGMSLIPVLLDWPLVLLPVHIVFLELIIDPACSVVFEAECEEADVMKRAPRSTSDRLFGSRAIVLSLLQGFVVLGIVFAMYAFSYLSGRGEDEARALSFTTLIVANLGLILTNRSWTRTISEIIRMPNAAQWYVMAGATFFLGLVLCTPFLRDVFRFDTLHWSDIGFCLVMGVLSILWFEMVKYFHSVRTHRTRS